MPYVITLACVGRRDTSCYDVCPVDAIHPAPDNPAHDTHDQLYIDPDTCIDCGACEAACPHSAIFEESEVPAELESFVKINADFFRE